LSGQTPASIYKETWGYRSWQVRGDKDEKIQELSDTARKVVQEGGNYLLNIGLMGNGAIQSLSRRCSRASELSWPKIR
jgi:alpha-L-fucosidase